MLPLVAPSMTNVREPDELVGTHTTPSGRSLTTRGSVSIPRSLDTLT